MKETQEKIVFDIVRDSQPIRTEQVKIQAMWKGISCADRYLRWLQEKGKVKSFYCKGDRTKTWVVSNEKT